MMALFQFDQRLRYSLIANERCGFSMGPSYQVRSRSSQPRGSRCENSIKEAPARVLGQRTADFHSVLLVSVGVTPNRACKNSNIFSAPSEWKEQVKNHGFLLATANTKNQSSPKGPSFVVYSATSTMLSDLMCHRRCPDSSQYSRASSKTAMVARPFFFPSPP